MSLKSRMIVSMKNQMSRFLYLWNAGHYDQIAESLFDRQDVSLSFPDKGIELCGYDRICAFLQGRKNSKEPQTVHYLNSPSVSVAENGSAVQGSWMTASYEFFPDGRLQYYVSRIDVSFRWDTAEQCCRIRCMAWYDMAALMPRESVGLVTAEDSLWIPEHGVDAEPEDYVALQNLLSRVSHYRLAGTEDLFVSDESGKFYIEGLIPQPACGRQEIGDSLCRIRRREEENNDYYLFHFMAMTPLIEKDGVDAKGSWHYIAYEADQNASAENGKPMIVSSGMLRAEFVKEKKEWKIRTFIAKKEFTLEKTRIDGLFRQRDDMPDRACWRDPPPFDGERTADPEDYFAIENVMGEWASQIRNCAPAYFYEHCVDTENPDVYYSVPDPRPFVKEHIRKEIGVDKILSDWEMELRFDKMQPKTPGNHSPSTPYIRVSADGQQAVGVWFEYGWTMMGAAFGNETFPIPVLPSVGRYEHHLIRRGDGWRVWGFNWRPLYQPDIWMYHKDMSRGWSRSGSMRRWPRALEPYFYSDGSDGVNEFLQNDIEKYMPEELQAEAIALVDPRKKP